MISGTPKYRIQYATRFKRDLKSFAYDQKLLKELQYVVDTLATGLILDQKYKDHALKGEFRNCRECHIKPDVLLVYEYIDDRLELYLLRLGSHSDLFG